MQVALVPTHCPHCGIRLALVAEHCGKELSICRPQGRQRGRGAEFHDYGAQLAAVGGHDSVVRSAVLTESAANGRQPTAIGVPHP